MTQTSRQFPALSDNQRPPVKGPKRPPKKSR